MTQSENGHHAHAHNVGYGSPQDAMQAPREEIVYVAGLHVGTDVDEPDFLAVVDVDPASETYSEIVHKTPMPNVGDELHHYGWQVCSSGCHSHLNREHLIVPGIRSSRLHIVHVGNPRQPEITKVIEPEELIDKTGYTRPHTVHCMPGEIITISMLGDRDGNAPGGFAVLDAETFEVIGPWERAKNGQELMYDFWYQPRLNTLISSEWAPPNVYERGFHLEDVQNGQYGRQLHFWDLDKREAIQSIDLGEEGLIPLEIRWLHDPEAKTGFVGAALSSAIWRFYWDHDAQQWDAEKVTQVDPVEIEGWDIPVPGLITDLIVSMDDRWLYHSNWLQGDLRQYDVSNPAEPTLVDRLWLGGLLHDDVRHPNGRRLTGGPQMVQLSMDGRRLYVTNSLYSSWDNQFYPDLASWMLKVDVDPENGGMELDPDFYVDFSPARAHEMHLPTGDPTTEIFP